MTLYSVYERKDDTPTVVADRFSWSAALVPPVHALVHGLWLLLALWVVGVVGLGLAGLWIGGGVAFWLYVLFAILIGFEASTFRRRAMARRQAQFRGDIIASSEDLALLEYLKRPAQ